MRKSNLLYRTHSLNHITTFFQDFKSRFILTPYFILNNPKKHRVNGFLAWDTWKTNAEIESMLAHLSSGIPTMILLSTLVIGKA